MALDAFHCLPGDTPARETVLAPGELIVAVSLPAEAAAFARHSRYLKLRDRTSYAFALVSAAAALRHARMAAIGEARLALGGVAAKPWRAREAEAILAGRRPDTAAVCRSGAGCSGRGAALGRQCLQDRADPPRRCARAQRWRRPARRHGIAALPASPMAPTRGVLTHA